MKLHVLSDLHCEFADFVPPVVDCDVVVLAGDIHVKSRGGQMGQPDLQHACHICHGQS